MSDAIIRLAEESDLDGIIRLVDEFSIGHPSENYPRNKEEYIKVYFSDDPKVEIAVAERGGEIIGMLQWSMSFDMYWSIYHGIPEWFYVRKDSRGSGICISLFAFICDRVRRKGGRGCQEFCVNSEYNKGVNTCQKTILS